MRIVVICRTDQCLGRLHEPRAVARHRSMTKVPTSSSELDERGHVQARASIPRKGVEVEGDNISREPSAMRHV
jgi:hypothetical protein